MNQPSSHITALPPDDLHELTDLSTFLQSHAEPAALLGPDGQQVPLTQQTYEILMGVVAAMSAGQAIVVSPLNKTLTTQQAADFLGVSRPTLVRLLEEGHIAYSKVGGGTHRRVALADLVEYQDRQKHERERNLSELVKTAEEQNLYAGNPDQYEDAVRRARRG